MTANFWSGTDFSTLLLNGVLNFPVGLFTRGVSSDPAQRQHMISFLRASFVTRHIATGLNTPADAHRLSDIHRNSYRTKRGMYSTPRTNTWPKF